jgi:hypothetical protein
MHLYLKYQSSSTFDSKDIVQVKVHQKGQSSRSRSQGQKSWYQKKGVFMSYLYVKYQHPIPNSFKRYSPG